MSLVKLLCRLARVHSQQAFTPSSSLVYITVSIDVSYHQSSILMREPMGIGEGMRGGRFCGASQSAIGCLGTLSLIHHCLKIEATPTCKITPSRYGACDRSRWLQCSASDVSATVNHYHSRVFESWQEDSLGDIQAILSILNHFTKRTDSGDAPWPGSLEIRLTGSCAMQDAAGQAPPPTFCSKPKKMHSRLAKIILDLPRNLRLPDWNSDQREHFVTMSMVLIEANKSSQ